MTDWKAVDPATLKDDVIGNTQIALALGWGVYAIPGYDPQSPRFILLQPNGEPWLPHDGREQAVIGGVKETVESFASPVEAWRTAPAWTTSVDAALGLIPVYDDFPIAGFFFYMDVWSQTKKMVAYRAIIPHPQGAFGKEYVGVADTPSLAICRAWLAWKQAQEATS